MWGLFLCREHTELVTGLDWGHKTNRIISCSFDRNAMVWTFGNGVWKPTLVILRLVRFLLQLFVPLFFFFFSHSFAEPPRAAGVRWKTSLR
jgi:hypothetical protein